MGRGCGACGTSSGLRGVGAVSQGTGQDRGGRKEDLVWEMGRSRPADCRQVARESGMAGEDCLSQGT